MKITKFKSFFFISKLAKQTYLESNQIFFPIGVENNQGSRRKKIGLEQKVKRRHQYYIKASSYWHCN